jgi:hypothetical protein
MQRHRTPGLEVLQERTVPSTLEVWRSADDLNVAGTLRYAVAHAAAGDTIHLAANLRTTPIVLTGRELQLNKQ